MGPVHSSGAEVGAFWYEQSSEAGKHLWRYPGVQALKAINLQWACEIRTTPGKWRRQIHLMKIQAVSASGRGQSLIDGQAREFTTYQDAIIGFSIVFQEFSLIPYLTAVKISSSAMS